MPPLEVELPCRGLPLFVPNLATEPDVDEETAVTAGLQGAGLGVLPDRSSTTTPGAQTTIRLGFDL
jgi:hypothetical protein